MKAAETTPKVKCYHCNCSEEYHLRIKRNFFVRQFLFWLPLKHYLCGLCVKRYYVIGDNNSFAPSLNVLLKYAVSHKYAVSQ